MFTGIVEDLGLVRDVIVQEPGRRLVIQSRWDSGDVRIGDSIAVNGVCLTAVRLADTALEFQVGPETLARTNLGALRSGEPVNLERALLPTTRLGGHFVQGHVDGIARVSERRRDAEWEWFECAADPDLLAPMIPKGSVAVDGVSLTLVTVSRDRFGMMLIPHTLEHTTLGRRAIGDTVNVETDILGKYVLHAVRRDRTEP
jgi:riboflavin synthase